VRPRKLLGDPRRTERFVLCRSPLNSMPRSRQVKNRDIESCTELMKHAEHRGCCTGVSVLDSLRLLVPMPIAAGVFCSNVIQPTLNQTGELNATSD